MFLDGSLLPAGLWYGAAAVVAAYTVLFLLTARPVTLRLRRLGILALVVSGLRLSSVLFGYPLEGFWEPILTVVVLMGGAILGLSGRIWLIRIEAEAFREQFQAACRGLFLECKEPTPGDYQLLARGKMWRLRVRPLSRRVQIFVLPKVTEPGKMALLVQWLSKQYPGPVPRVHIVLKKE